MRKAIPLLLIVLGSFLVARTASGVTVYYGDMLLDYKYYESYSPWSTPDRLRMMADTGVDSDSAKMKLEFDGTVYPLSYWGYFTPTDFAPFHDYGTVFNIPPNPPPGSAWEDKTYTFWDDADDDDVLDPGNEAHIQFYIPSGTYRQLGLPQNISISPDGIVSWDEVEHADYYKVRAQAIVGGTPQGDWLVDSGRLHPDGSGRMSWDLGSSMDVIMSDDVLMFIASRETMIIADVEHIVNQSRFYFEPGNYLVPDLCKGDFDADGDVDGSDLAVFAADFGRTDCQTESQCEGDFDNDGDVDGTDLAAFAADFGRTECP